MKFPVAFSVETTVQGPASAEARCTFMGMELAPDHENWKPDAGAKLGDKATGAKSFVDRPL